MEQNQRRQMEEYKNRYCIPCRLAKGRDCSGLAYLVGKSADRTFFIRFFMLANYLGA